jgi:hypothetical protein
MRLFAGLASGRSRCVLFLTGLWPVFHMKSFEAITGKKRDKWLVQTFGATIAAVGAAMLAGAAEQPRSQTLRVLGLSTTAMLGAADMVFSLSGVIRKVYLADAAVEAALFSAWLAHGKA